HSRRDPALEIAGDVLDGFTPAQRDVLWRLDHVATQLANRDLKRGAGAERWLLEQQRDVASLERTGVRTSGRTRGLEISRERKAGPQFGRPEIEHREELRRHIDSRQEYC